MLLRNAIWVAIQKKTFLENKADWLISRGVFFVPLSQFPHAVGPYPRSRLVRVPFSNFVPAPVGKNAGKRDNLFEYFLPYYVFFLELQFVATKHSAIYHDLLL